MFFGKDDDRTGEELRIDVYTPYEAFSPVQKKRAKNLFLRLVFELAVTDLCILGVFAMNDILLAVIGIYFAVRAVSDIRLYGSLVLGDGIHTAIFFAEKGIRIINGTDDVEIAYRDITDAAFFENGLVMRFKNGGGFRADMESVKNSGCGEEVLSLLKKKLGSRLKNRFSDPEYRLEKAEKEAAAEEKRRERLGARMTEVSYEVENGDCRRYCRVLFGCGAGQKFARTAIPVTGALCTGALIIYAMTGEDIFNVLSYVLAAVLIMLLFAVKIGLAAPGKRRLAAKPGSVLISRIYLDGIWAAAGEKELLATWKEINGICFAPGEGFAFDLGDRGVILLPSDMMTEEMAEQVDERIRRCRGEPEKEKTEG